MNKLNLNRYFNKIKKDGCTELKGKYTIYKEPQKDYYIISNTYSIVLLNSDYGVLTQYQGKLSESIKHICNDFQYNYTLKKIDITNEVNACNEDVFRCVTEYVGDIKEENIITNYGVCIKLYNNIKNLIKANKAYLLTGYNYDCNYVIKIENTKTGEIGYLLPVKIF